MAATTAARTSVRFLFAAVVVGIVSILFTQGVFPSMRRMQAADQSGVLSPPFPLHQCVVLPFAVLKYVQAVAPFAIFIELFFSLCLVASLSCILGYCLPTSAIETSPANRSLCIASLALACLHAAASIGVIILYFWIVVGWMPATEYPPSRWDDYYYSVAFVFALDVISMAALFTACVCSAVLYARLVAEFDSDLVLPTTAPKVSKDLAGEAQAIVQHSPNVEVVVSTSAPKVSQDKTGEGVLYHRWSWALIGVVVGAIGLSIIPAIVKYFVFNSLPAVIIENVFVLPLIAILASIHCIFKFPPGIERRLVQAALGLAVVDVILSVAGSVLLRFTYYFYFAVYIFWALSITATVCLAASIILASLLAHRMRVAFVSGCVSA
jgi:hypothetical protein